MSSVLVTVPYQLRNLAKTANGRWNAEKKQWEIADGVRLDALRVAIAEFEKAEVEKPKEKTPARPKLGEEWELVGIPFVGGDDIRAFAKSKGARFDPETKKWKVPTHAVAEVKLQLRAKFSWNDEVPK